MRKVSLRMNELSKHEIIKKLVETCGNKKRATLKLSCTIRTINRLIGIYRNNGKEGFVHGNRSRKPTTAFSHDSKDKIIELYTSKYVNANISHFSELLLERETIKVNETTVLRWLSAMDILSPKARRKTKKKLKNKLSKLRKGTNTNKNIIALENKLELLARSEAHPHRPRHAYFGELIQMDASPHVWFNGIGTHLHLEIDDSTGKIVEAFFDTQETVHANCQITHQILTQHGIPAKILTDRRTVFEYKRKNAPSDEEKPFTG